MKDIHLFYIAAIIAVIFGFAPFAGLTKAQDGSGKIIAGIDFDPKSDGFKFRNYGYRPENSSELSAADLIMMFGADKVCIEGQTADDCVLYETAARWMRDRVETLSSGHCDGFSVSAMRIWLKLPFKEKTTAKQWNESAEITNNLEFDEGLANYIAYYHSLQGLKEINAFRTRSFKFPPTEIIKLLVESFETKKDYYTLAVGIRVNGKYTKGHSILPIAVEDMGSGVYRIHVYDNNFPDEIKYVTVDSKTETWRYRTASNPEEEESDYTGDRNSRTFSLKKMSDREVKTFKSPFSEVSRTPDGSTAGGGEGTVNFAFNGPGNLLITDPNDQKIGFDAAKQSEVNQIPDGEVVYYDGGLALDYSPEYLLPYQTKAKKPYRISISGKDLKQETKAGLRIAAPGFVVGFQDILLDPREELLVSMSPDGQTLTITASADRETPTIFVTTEDGPNKPSYSFEVGGVALDAGKSLTMHVDLKAGKVFFKDNDGNEDAYDIRFERTNADGGKIEFDQDNVDLKGADSFEIDINTWNNKQPPCVKDDDDGDGFTDETCGDADDPDSTPGK